MNFYLFWGTDPDILHTTLWGVWGLAWIYLYVLMPNQ